MNDYSKTAVKKNSTMSYQEFYKTYYLPHYKQQVRDSTYENRVVSMNKHFKYFFKRKVKDINAPMIKKWQKYFSKGIYKRIYSFHIRFFSKNVRFSCNFRSTSEKYS